MAGLTPELIRELDLPQFEDAETARRYLEEQAWPEGPVCPFCNSVDRSYMINGARTRPGLYSCADCRNRGKAGHYTVTVKTAFHSTRVPLHKWLQVTAAVERMPATIHEIGDAIGVTYKTAWRMRGIIRPELLRKNGGQRRQFLYPFLTTYRETPEHEMLRAISQAVPSNIPPDRRADICQELALAVLIGEAETKSLQTDWMKSFRKVYKMHPTLFADRSLDAPIPGTEDLRLIDTLTAESMSWE
jgi:ribosomal protein L37AE/L43A